MKRKVDILVIGGGVIGVCSAYYLAKRGRSVTIVEKGEIGSGSSYGNAGLVVPSHSRPFAEPETLKQGLRWVFDRESPFYIKPRLSIDLLSWLWKFFCQSQISFRLNRARKNIRGKQAGLKAIFDLSIKSLKLYQELASHENLDFNFEQQGLMVICMSGKGLKAVFKDGRQIEELGFDVKFLDPLEIRNLNPAVRSNVKGGVYFPQDAHLIPHKFVRELARCAEKQGVEIRTSIEVLGLETEGGKVTVVRTTGGDFEPGEVVLAGGCWSPAIMHDLKLKLPIQPAKGYSITVKRPEKYPALPVGLFEAKVYITPMGETLRFAGTLELSGFDLSINYRRIQAIIRAVSHYFSDLNFDQFEFPEFWSGLRPFTPDGFPLLGRSRRYENLIIAAGHGTLGMSLGPISGELVSQLAVKIPPEYDLSLFDVERFN